MLASPGFSFAGEIPFPDALDRAAIEVDSLSSILKHALIIGNGDINALLWVENGRPALMLTKNDVWDARLDSKLDPPIPTLALIKKYASNPSAGGSAALTPKGWSKRGKDSYHAHPYPCPRACAKLVLGDSSAKAVEAPASSGRIDVRRAVATLSGPAGAEVRALADRNVFLIRSAARGTLIPVTSADTPKAMTGAEDDVRWLTQTMPGDADWPGMSYAVAVADRAELQAVAIVTSREAKDPRAAAIKLARETVAAKTDRLVAEHEAVWESFWAQSGIRLSDTFLTDAWYRNLYYLRCVTKPGVIPPGLFASLVNSAPAWHGDYHTNYNIQQTFWSAFNTNHPGLAEPYARLMREYLPRAQWLCRQIFGFEGAYFPHVIFAYEPDPETCKSPVGRQYIHHVWGYTMGVPAFTVQPVWWHYKYQPERAFLEKTAYPLVRGVALFQANFMDVCTVGADGQLVLGPTVSPEHWGWTKDFERNRNSTFDIAMFRYVFTAAIEGAQTLGCDAELVTRWRDALKRLPAYSTTGGDTPVVVDVKEAPPITYSIAVPVVPVFPGDVVTSFSSDAEKALFTRTVERTKWNGNNSIYIMGVSRARLSMAGTPEWLSKEIKARLRPNQTITLNRLGAGVNKHGHYTEQFGASMAIGELLLQSVGDVIRVLPAWPKDRDAAFANLRTQGGFLVSLEQKGGNIVALEIVSTVGGTLRVLSPWQTVKANGSVLTPDEKGIVEMKTKAGERFSLKP